MSTQRRERNANCYTISWRVGTSAHRRFGPEDSARRFLSGSRLCSVGRDRRHRHFGYRRGPRGRPTDADGRRPGAGTARTPSRARHSAAAARRGDARARARRGLSSIHGRRLADDRSPRPQLTVVVPTSPTAEPCTCRPRRTFQTRETAGGSSSIPEATRATTPTPTPVEVIGARRREAVCHAEAAHRGSVLGSGDPGDFDAVLERAIVHCSRRPSSRALRSIDERDAVNPSLESLPARQLGA